MTACISCGEPVRGWRWSGSGFVECRGCSLVFRDPMPSAADLDDLYADSYSDANLQADSTNMCSSDVSLEHMATFLARKLLRPGQRILDFGASSGFLVHDLAARGFDVTGVEPAEGARAEARRRYGIDILADLREVRGTFDWVIGIEVVEHLPDPVSTLRGLRDVLAPDGRIFLSTPNQRGLLARLHGPAWREAQKPFHLALFNSASLGETLRRAGFARPREIRLSPLTTRSALRGVAHRAMQSCGVYGGLRMTATRT